MARSRDDAARGLVCASGVTALSPFAVGYGDLKPTFAEAAVAPQRYRKGTEIDPLVLPAATGGDGPLAYALAPALPEGLAYTAPADATSGGTLAGTPTVPAQAAAWTLTATGASASNGASPAARLDTEMGYGLAAFAGVLTPYGGLGLSEGGARGYRLEARFLHGPAFELDLEGERRESRTERAGHGLMLRGRVRW